MWTSPESESEMALTTGFDWIEIPITVNEWAAVSYGLLFETKLGCIY